ncbi:MAG TPA: ABC transporter permease, partial [Bacteroidales bacterium]|nr:ABC transporter permease [Bacteroidales bacterium]
SALVIWGVVTLIFLLFNVLPGDPAQMMLGQRADLKNVQIIRQELGPDQPLYKQYLRYLNDLSFISVYQAANPDSYYFLDTDKYRGVTKIFTLKNGLSLVVKKPWLGRSFLSSRPVGDMISEALPNSLILAFFAIILAFVAGNILGVLSALKKDSWFDRTVLVVSTFGMSLPSFFAAILIAWLFAYKLGDITHLNLTGNLYEVDDLGRGIHLELKNLILPAVTLGIRPLSVVIQLSRNSMLDVLSQDYIRTAFAKGLRYSRVVIVHAFRNSLNPVVTAVSGWFAGMLAGVVFVEYIFGWHGLGYMIVNALNFYDFPVVLASVLTISVVFVAVNIIVDIIYVILDPRLRG